MSHARWPWFWIAGLAVASWTGTLGATPHSGMLSGPTARTWWDATRTSLGYSTPGAVVTPREAEVDRDPEEVEDEADDAGRRRPGARGPGLTPMQRQMVQGVVAEYVIYMKYLNLQNFKEGPVDWRNERFQYASLVPLRDIDRPNAPFRVDEKRIGKAIDDMEDILTEIGEPSVPLVAEALRNDVRYHGSARRRRSPLDYRTPAGVPAGDYNVQALERFDDIAYGLGNHRPFIPAKSNTFIRNTDYRRRSRRILLGVGRAALPVLRKHAADKDERVANAFKKLVREVEAGTMPSVRGNVEKKTFEPPPLDPAARKRAAERAKLRQRQAKLYKIWQQAEVAREQRDYATALERYHELLRSDPLPNYTRAATERIAEVQKAAADAAKAKAAADAAKKPPDADKDAGTGK